MKWFLVLGRWDVPAFSMGAAVMGQINASSFLSLPIEAENLPSVQTKMETTCLIRPHFSGGISRGGINPVRNKF